jgi:orotidine-5'-phosphate decarboxylase
VAQAGAERCFGDQLAARVAARESQLVLGLDPDPRRLWPDATSGADVPAGPPGLPAADAAAAAVHAHCEAVLEACAPACVAVKLQLACFERLGAPGRDVLGQVAGRARRAGLLVLADGKRGDIDVSAAAYADSLLGATPTPFGEVPGLGADALTVNPLLGRDSLEPFLQAARRTASGVFVLVRTSNPGAADVQDLLLQGGRPMWEHLAGIVADLGRVGSAGLSDVGAVVGATAPEHLARMRELMPTTPFLLPGVGAQGGQVEDLAPAFLPGSAGGLITASRSLVDAGRGEPRADLARAARREAERLRESAWRLSQSL